MIPKIIHQSAHSNMDEWHPIWKTCQKSVLNNFKGFEYMLWTDEKIDNFIKKEFKDLYDQYSSSPFHILKLDFSRYAILYFYGGIYIDMDIYCYSNFYDDLTKEVNLVESKCKDEMGLIEGVQNSLMASKEKNIFFKECIEEFFKRLKKVEFEKSHINKNHYQVKYTSGPIMLNDVYKKFKDNIKILPVENYAHEPLTYSILYKTKHMATGMWGTEVKEDFKDMQKKENYVASLEDYHLLSYLDKTSIKFKDFDFYKDYTITT